mmetsp:Transcript_17626/g.24291  ORF Transcript_17626/g.24291 Transcript_17626/m.24291 type:complete len:329 (-) Transcript_17626:639-1625(-)|eukprot:CAMPEP_0185733688 /NCGR_PEP_ID=MMETSP1171-20130828/20301_1 /TAXON_ID=374046 /ORGANISM="Helicotheca tamensis, Strain CCMP826" /LENGTH=328 /DNA_ID=CAMNT_0028403475 /DNA_START=23 /DNA_END=1009 /DNA_ORIENTATION=+
MIGAPADLAGLARILLSSQCKSVAFLTGAGVSVASGIPDFRSPGGMYDSLRPELITATPIQQQMMKDDPTYVVEKNMFLQNSFPYLEVRRPFILGTQQKKWKPTIAHRFMELLHTKTGKLTRAYTQNIDGLTEACENIPPEKIVAVHGTICKVSCEVCGTKVESFDDFCDEVRVNIKDIYKVDPEAPDESKPIRCKSCGRAAVKPTTVLFGSSLPQEFFERATEDLPSVDVLIVAGTSLMVSPANGLVYNVPESTLRVVVNNQPVGSDLGIDYSSNAKRDFFAEGNCDEVFLDLIEHLGWLDDLALFLDELPESSAALLQERLKSTSR